MDLLYIDAQTVSPMCISSGGMWFLFEGVYMVYDHNKGENTTKVALDPDERKKLLRAAKMFERSWGVFPYRTVATFMFTGMHIKVLADRAASRIRRVDPRLEWFRPKKKGKPALTSILIHHEIEPWIDEYIHSELPTSRQLYWAIVHMVAAKAGLPGVSPMTLRHTYGAMLDEFGLTPAEIQKNMNCGLKSLMSYTTRSRKFVDSKLMDAGWTGSRSAPPESEVGPDFELKVEYEELEE